MKIKRALELTMAQPNNSQIPKFPNLPDLDALLRTTHLAGGATALDFGSVLLCGFSGFILTPANGYLGMVFLTL